jgi:hypothetical protein
MDPEVSEPGVAFVILLFNLVVKKIGEGEKEIIISPHRKKRQLKRYTS